MRIRIGFFAVICALAVAGCTTGSQPGPTPSPSATPSALPSTAPSATPSATPAAQPTPAVLPADAPPQIVSVQLSDPVFHSGETVTGTVITSTNVAAVDVKVANQDRRLPKTADGIFTMTYTLPKIPFFMRGTYVARIIAQNSAGVTAEKDVTVSLH